MRGDKTKTSSPLEVKLREKYHAREARKKAQAYRPAILPPPEPEQRGDHAAAAEVSAPLSAAAKEELVTDIVAALDVDDERQSYCLDTVRFRLRSAKRLRRFYAKLLKPGERKEKLEALSRAWKKARKQLEDMKSDPLFRAQFEDGATPALDAPFTVNFPPPFDDHGDLDRMRAERDQAAAGCRQAQAALGWYRVMSGAYCGDRDFDSLKSGVDHLIAIADFLIEVTTVPPGQVPRDVGKWQAKLVAMNLVAEFSALAGKLGKGGKSGEPRVKGEKDITNDIASLIYEILTGREGADILEQSEAYAPPAIKTPFASDLPKQRKAATRRGEREVAELRKLTLKPLTKRK